MIARDETAVGFSAAAKAPEWHEARRGRMGGSDAGVIAGSPWKTPYQLWQEKCGAVEEPKTETEAMYWGTVLEAAVAQRWSDQTGRRIRRMPMVTSKVHPWMIANVDRQIIGEERGPGVLEVKTTNAWNRWDSLDDLPDQYYAQMQHYMYVLGYDWGAFAVLIGGNQFRAWDVEADRDYQELLVEAEVRFWNMVQTGVAPDVTGDDVAYLGRQFPTDNGATVTLEGGVWAEAARKVVEAKAQVKQIEALAAQAEADLKAAMGDCSEAVIPGWGRITWKAAKPTVKRKINEEQLAADGLLERYLVETTVPGSRRFLLREGK